MQYGAHVSHMGQMLNECMVSGPHLQRYPEEHRPLPCLLKQVQQKNLNKRKTSNITDADKVPKIPTISTRFLDGALRGAMLLYRTKTTK